MTRILERHITSHHSKVCVCVWRFCHFNLSNIFCLDALCHWLRLLDQTLDVLRSISHHERDLQSIHPSIHPSINQSIESSRWIATEEKNSAERLARPKHGRKRQICLEDFRHPTVKMWEIYCFSIYNRLKINKLSYRSTATEEKRKLRLGKRGNNSMCVWGVMIVERWRQSLFLGTEVKIIDLLP